MNVLTIPHVPPPIVTWIHNYAYRNLWKVEGLCDKEDLIQEGYYAIAYCLRKYGTELAPPHLMRLVQITFSCAIIDIAKKRTRSAEDYTSDPEQATFIGRDTQSQLDRLVSEAPTVVRKALEFLINDYKGDMRESYKMSDQGRETTSNRISSLLGIDTDSFLMDKIRSYLKGD